MTFTYETKCQYRKQSTNQTLLLTSLLVTLEKMNSAQTHQSVTRESRESRVSRLTNVMRHLHIL